MIKFLQRFTVPAVLSLSLLQPRLLTAADSTGLDRPAISWDQLGSTAQKQYSGAGIGITPTPLGARLRATLQALEAEATVDGLWLTSTTAEDMDKQASFRISAAQVGRQDSRSPTALLPAQGTVHVSPETATFARPGLLEEYTVSMDGIRQDFLILDRPAGAGRLQLALEVTGARVETASYGAKLTVHGSGREIAYSRLCVTDATGRRLDARMEMETNHRILVRVDDSATVYPVRIDPTFSDADWVSMGGLAGTDQMIWAMTFDAAGNLYVGGEFTFAGTAAANYIAKWNGTTWSSLGTGLDGGVYALTVSGANVYAGGYFTTAGGVETGCVARWNGSAWSALGTGVDGQVQALLAVGNDLYVGGSFTDAGGVVVKGIAKWNGSAWSAFGSGVEGYVNALALSGSTLYVGGFFTKAGEVDANNIAKWSDGAWSALGTGLDDSVNALAVSGSTLYVGGDFYEAGDQPASFIAKWENNTWSALGLGTNSSVKALVVSGSTLYVGGLFTLAGEYLADGFATWNGNSWVSYTVDEEDLPFVTSLVVSGTNVYLGGEFTDLGGVSANNVIKRENGVWKRLGSGIDGEVHALAVSDTDLYLGGAFTAIGSIAANHVARWNGYSWIALGGGVDATVRALAFSQGALYVGGDFGTADGIPASHIAKWSGRSWSSLGSGVSDGTGGGSGAVTSLIASGGTVYLGGRFEAVGGVSANNIAQWNGTTWSALGSGIEPGVVLALALSGTDLYVGGYFSTAGGLNANSIAKWNGTAWSTLGLGIDAQVCALATSGTDLYVGGDFYSAGGLPANNIAKWNGAVWSTLNYGAPNHRIRSLALHRGDLYVGGNSLGPGFPFPDDDGYVNNSISVWNGSAWKTPGSGMSTRSSVNALIVSGATLYVAGDFVTAGEKLSPNIAKLLLPSPEIVVSGNGVEILNGDSMPRPEDNTAFGTERVGGGSLVRTFTVANTKTLSLNLTGTPAVAISGSHPADFTVTAPPATSVAGNGSTIFQITFNPTGIGLRTAVVTIANDDADEHPYTFAISGNGKLDNPAAQSIAFTPPTKCYLAEGPLTLSASASSDLPVVFTVLSGKATVAGDVLTLTGTGPVKLRASQPGNAEFLPAPFVERTLTVAANPTTLTLTGLSRVYDGTAQPIEVVGTSEMVTISYKIGSIFVANPPVNVGAYSVKVVSGNTTKTGTLTITKAPLFVTPHDQRRFAGQPNPPFGFDYEGFLGSDNPANSITKAPTVATTASASSPGGLYPITPSGGASANYAFVYQKGTLVVETFAGSYEALLPGQGSGRPAALLQLTVVASSKTFSGKLIVATETAPLSFTGTLATNLTTETAAGTVSVKKGANTYGVNFTLPLTGDFTTSATLNSAPLGTASNGRKLLVLAKGQTLSYTGAHTAVLAPAQPSGPLAPAGAGWATATIDAKGTLKLTGRLPDGTSFTASLAADVAAAPGYRLFVQPYTPARTHSLLAGAFALTAHPDLAGRRHVAFAAAANLTWMKAARSQDTAYRAGIGPFDTQLTLDPWLPPAAAKGVAPAVSLAQRLGLTGPENQFLAQHSAFESALFADLPQTLALNAKTNVVTVIAPATTPANKTKWKNTLTPATGAFTGTFDLVDGTAKRKVSFTGVLRQPPSTDLDSPIGSGHLLLPALPSAPSNEQLSGEVRFTLP